MRRDFLADRRTITTAVLQSAPVRVAWLAVLALFPLAIVLGSLLAYLLLPLVDLPYERVLTRSVLLATAALILLGWRVLRLSRAELGFTGFSFRALGCGWCVGILLILPVTAVFIGTGFRVLDVGRAVLGPELLTFTAYAFVAACLVGLFEETLFRGLLQALFTRAHGAVVAACVTSLIYAAVHFLELPDTAPAPGWFAGAAWALGAFAPLADPASWWDSFLPLFALGLLLSWCRAATGSLAWCIAMHSAWVFFIRMLKELTVRDVVNPWAFLVGDYDHFVGLLVLGWLVLIGAVLALRGRRLAALARE